HIVTPKTRLFPLIHLKHLFRWTANLSKKPHISIIILYIFLVTDYIDPRPALHQLHKKYKRTKTELLCYGITSRSFQQSLRPCSTTAPLTTRRSMRYISVVWSPVTAASS